MVEQKEIENQEKTEAEKLKEKRSQRLGVGYDETLYEQIAANDEIEIQTRRKSSFLMSVMVSYMRMTLLIDAKRREYEKEFRILGMIWSAFMSLLYLSGVTMFAIFVVSYMQFPTYVKNYLDKNGILYERMEIPGYVVSQIELYGLHDKSNTYQIKNVSVSSTFADFLNKRAKSVSLKGLRLIIDQTGKSESGLLTPIAELNRTVQSGGGIRVDSLELSDAILTVKGQNYELPISISLTGVYGRSTNISAYVNIDEPYLSAKGPMLVRDVKDGISWDWDIQSGSVVLPGRPRETLAGKVTLKTKQGRILSFGTNIRLLYDRLERQFKVSLEKDAQSLYRGRIDMAWTDVSVPTNPVSRTSIGLGVSGVTFTSEGGAKTDKPIAVNLSTIYSSQLQVKDLVGSLNGNLVCHLDEGCSYELKQRSTLNAKWLRLPILGTPLNSQKETRLMLTPVKDFLNVSWKEGQLRFNIANQNLRFSGNQTETKMTASLSVGKSQLTGMMGLWNDQFKVGLSAENINYATQLEEITDAKLTMNDALGGKGKTIFNSPKVLLKNNDYLKIPFGVDYVRNNNDTKIAIDMENKKIRMGFDGYFDPDTGVIDGSFVVPEVNLANIKPPFNRLSSKLSEEILAASGKVAAYGMLRGNIYGNLSGPVYMALSDVSLKTEDIQVDKINAALSIQSLQPFMTEMEQDIFIEGISAFIPIENIRLSVRLDNKFAQLTRLSATIAGIPLDAEPTLVPYKGVGTLLYLKNQNSDLSKVAKGIKLTDWVFDGKISGNILIPVEVKDLGVNVRNAVVQLSKATLKYSGKEAAKPAFMENNKQFDIQSGTITIDDSNNDDNRVKVSLVLDTLIGYEQKKKIKKMVRYAFEKPLSGLIVFSNKTNFKVPNEILKRVNQLLKQVEKAKR